MLNRFIPCIRPGGLCENKSKKCMIWPAWMLVALMAFFNPAALGAGRAHPVTGHEVGGSAAEVGGTAGTGDEVQIPQRPHFEATSAEPVLLRYKFAPGQSFKMFIDMGITIKMEAAGQSMEIPMVMTMKGELRTLSVEPSGDYRLSAVFKQVTLRSSGIANINYNSSADTKTTDPALQYFGAMVNTPVQVKITPTGKVLETDYTLLEEALKRAGAVAKIGKLTRDMDKSMRRAFTMLSTDPVKTGEIYSAGELAEQAGELGEMRGAVKYEVLAVSADKKQALLKPIVQMTFKPSPSAPIQPKLESGEMQGWVLFDVERGNIIRSAGALDSVLSISQGDQSMKIKVGLRVVYQTQ